MSRRLAVLRPEPGNAATAARVEAAGFTALRLPLFVVRPLAWSAPDPVRFDGLLLTSANAVRYAGAGLDQLRELPVIAVGAATAAAAGAAGFRVALVGEDGAADASDRAARAGYAQLLHLAGRDHIATGSTVAAAIPVYASDPQPIAAADLTGLAGSVALLHSARAARRLASLVDPAEIAIAALSAAIAAAAGSGWRAVAVSPAREDAALIAAAAPLAD